VKYDKLRNLVGLFIPGDVVLGVRAKGPCGKTRFLFFCHTPREDPHQGAIHEGCKQNQKATG
jgi:hypothetical protein